MTYLLYILIGIAGVWLGWRLALSGKKRKFSAKVNENKAKIMELFKERDEIANRDVEKLLGVSDATATNYLDRLEKEGKIKQIGGSVGRGVHYKING